MNSCPLPPTWVVAGQAMRADGEIVNVIVTCCELHQPSVAQWLGEMGGQAVVADIGAADDMAAWIMREMGPVYEMAEAG